MFRNLQNVEKSKIFIFDFQPIATTTLREVNKFHTQSKISYPLIKSALCKRTKLNQIPILIVILFLDAWYVHRVSYKLLQLRFSTSVIIFTFSANQTEMQYL